MSDTDAATMAKCLPWLARVIEDELIPLLRELRDRLPRETKSAPPAFAQPELPGMHATPPVTTERRLDRDGLPEPKPWVASADVVDCHGNKVGTVIQEVPPKTQVDSNGIITGSDGEVLGVIAEHDSAELPDGLVWTNPKPPPRPPAWSNTVKVFDLIYARFCVGDFRLGELAGNAEFVAEVRKATANRVGVASFSRILSTLVRAGAVTRKARDLYCIPVAPSDLIRARIEDATRKGNLHNKPKEKVA